MAMRLFTRFSILTIIGLMMLLTGYSPVSPSVASADSVESNERIKRIEQFVEKQRVKGKIPGVSVIIVEQGKTVYQQGFGYSDVKSKQPVTDDTLFELGSTTKAFTALAILQLEQEGLLQRSDPIRKYIPWLELTYNGKPQEITIDQFIHHKSGIPSSTIVHIPESNAEDALELTVRTLQDKSLNRKPGSSYEYATINYDVLGLVIETVAKQPYDVYIKENILEPLGMNHSYVGLHQAEAQSVKTATGYKIGFKKEQIYNPPIYRGNIPAGYLISNAHDIAKWMNVQMLSEPGSPIDPELITLSHTPDRTVKPSNTNTYYAHGWSVLKIKERSYILHDGSNPTFSSIIILRPDEQVGVAVLSNMRSTFTTAIGQGVMDLWEGRTASDHHVDIYQKLDEIVTVICQAIGLIGIIFLILIIVILIRLMQRKRHWISLGGKRRLLLVIHSLMVAAILIFISIIPKVLLGGLTWSFIRVWAPTSFWFALVSTWIAGIIFYAYVSLLIFTKKTGEAVTVSITIMNKSR